MQKVNITNTDINLSILGLGTVKLGRNTAVKYPTAFDIPNDKTALSILNTAAECGINLIDTAPAYGNSETRLGKLIKHTSQEWVISTKVGEIFNAATGQSTYNFSPKHIQNSIENSLRQLQREYLDIVLIHSDGNDERIIQEDGALDTLNRLKQKGLIRATGMSAKTVEGGILTAQHSDIVMVTHNLAYQDEVDVMHYAQQQNKNIFIKKALASGHSALAQDNAADVEDQVQKSFDCIYQHPSVSSIILGSITPSHIKENAKKAMKSFSLYHSQ
jgi:aryl-alcohol dehydrogenase-like predicted oxidoreductase